VSWRPPWRLGWCFHVPRSCRYAVEALLVTIGVSLEFSRSRILYLRKRKFEKESVFGTPSLSVNIYQEHSIYRHESQVMSTAPYESLESVVRVLPGLGHLFTLHLGCKISESWEICIVLDHRTLQRVLVASRAAFPYCRPPYPQHGWTVRHHWGLPEFSVSSF